MTLLTGSSDLSLRPGRSHVSRQGTSCSGVAQGGSATSWHLELPGRPRLLVQDTCWDNGERDVVLHPAAKPHDLPLALSNLHGRRRAGIAPAGRGRERIMAYLALPQANGWPRTRKALTAAELVEATDADLLRDLLSRPGVLLTPAADLTAGQDVGRAQHEIHFDKDDRRTPVTAYVLTRVLPTLRHIGWVA